MNRRFITLEGIDGAGKSTHIKEIENFLLARGHDVVVTREPGGTPIGEQLREILLTQSMHAETEALLMFAARRDHVESVIRPALARAAWVVTDRFSDASYAYQGGGRAVAMDKLESLERWVHEDLQPGLTLLFDCPVEAARRRRASQQDRFEREDIEFFKRVRQVYLERARQFPRRFRVIDSSQSVTQVSAALQKILSDYCA